MSNAGKARMSIGRTATSHHFEMVLPKICIEEVYSMGNVIVQGRECGQ
jgi:hypothetical protein